MATVKSAGDYPLHDAAEAGDHAKLLALLSDDNDDDFDPEADIDDILIDAIDIYGMTPLQLSALGLHKLCIDVCIQNRASVQRTVDSMGLCHLAVVGAQTADTSFSEVLEALVAAGASATQADGDGCTPLHYACGFGDASSAEALLKLDASIVDSVDRHQRSALHHASGSGHMAVVNALLKAGANSSLEDVDGNTAAHLAALAGFQEVAKALPSSQSTNRLGQTVADILQKSSVDGSHETLVLYHDSYFNHHTCPPIKRGGQEPPPENVARLNVLVDEGSGALRAKLLQGLKWRDDAPRCKVRWCGIRCAVT